MKSNTRKQDTHFKKMNTTFGQFLHVDIHPKACAVLKYYLEDLGETSKCCTEFVQALAK